MSNQVYIFSLPSPILKQTSTAVLDPHHLKVEVED